jgi:hypothetical protein
MAMTIEERQQRLTERRLTREIVGYCYGAIAVLNHRAEILEKNAARNARSGRLYGERAKLGKASQLRRVAMLLASIRNADDFRRGNLLERWARLPAVTRR